MPEAGVLMYPAALGSRGLFINVWNKLFNRWCDSKLFFSFGFASSLLDPRQSQSPYNVFLSGCSYYTAKISYGRNVSIFMKRETLQKRHKQSNKHVFRVCMHSYMYITKVT